MDRIIYDERKKQANIKYSGNQSNFQTNAPIVPEVNSTNVFLTYADLEDLKNTIVKYSTDYGKELSGLISYLNKVISEYTELVNKITSLEEYLEDLSGEMNPNAGIINGVEVPDIGYYIKDEDDEGYFKSELIPRLNKIYISSIQAVNHAIATIIDDLISQIKDAEDSDGNKIFNEKFLSNLTYYKDLSYKHSDADERFIIKEPHIGYEEFEDHGSIELFKTDQQKYNKIKNLTRGNDITQVILAGSNEEAGGIIIQSLGKNYSYKRNSIDNEPLFPFIVKSKAHSLKNGMLTDVKSTFDEAVSNFIKIINNEITTLLNDFNSNSVFFSTPSGEYFAYEGGNKKTYINGNQLDINVRKVVNCGPVTYVITTDNTLFVTGGVGNDYGNLGLGSYDGVSKWEVVDFFRQMVADVIVDSSQSSAFLITVDGDIYAAGLNIDYKLGIGNIEKVNTFTKCYLPNDEKVKYFYTNKNSSFIVTENNNLYVAGLNNYGQLGFDMDSTPVIKNFVYLRSLSGENVQIYCDGATTYILDNNILYGMGYNHEFQVKEYNSYDELSIGFTKMLENVETIVKTGLFVTKDNYLYVCGKNDCMQLGISNVRNGKVEIRTPLTKIDKQVYSFSCTPTNLFVIDYDQNLWIAGKNESWFPLYDKDSKYIPLMEAKHYVDIDNHIESVFTCMDRVYYITKNKCLYYYRSESDTFEEVIEISGFVLEDNITVVDDAIYLIGENRSLYVCGNNDNRQLGYFDDVDDEKLKEFFQKVTVTQMVNNVKKLVVEGKCAIVLTYDGKILATGNNESGAFGFNFTLPDWELIELPFTVKDIVYNGGSLFLADNKDELFVSGSNASGKIGTDSEVQYEVIEAGDLMDKFSKFFEMPDKSVVIEQSI